MPQKHLLKVTNQSTYHFAKKESGGKGFNLYLLNSIGLNVPKFITLTPEVFSLFKKETEIDSYIDQVFSNKNLTLQNISGQIKDKIMATSFSKSLAAEIFKIYHELNQKIISVRSSAHDEDSALHSFAGQLSSFLYLSDFDSTLNAIKECWASAFSERSLHYRTINKLELKNILVSVVLQEMIDPEVSGVLFTCNPINGFSEQIFINSVYGVGEGLVSGLLDADTYILAKTNGEVLEKTIIEKNKKLIRNQKQGGCEEVEVSKEFQDVDSLRPEDLKQLHQLALKLELFYGRPQDIEWAIKNGELYILQARPVTTSLLNTNGTLFIWDNSNIVESYGGLTLPLTFGFAHYVYHQVYLQFCEVLLVPQKSIKEMDIYLKNMLGLFYGRIYYNLLNWYKLISILPGYKNNRSFMETMMGTNQAIQDEVAERVKPSDFQSGPGAFFRQLRTGLKFLYFHFFIQKVVDNFQKEFKVVYDRFRKIDYKSLPADKIYDHFVKLEHDILRKWHAPIINDTLCMVHYGIFKKLTTKWLAHLGDTFYNDLLAGNGNLESALPTKQLIKLSGDVCKNEELKKLILSTPNHQCLEALVQNGYIEFYKLTLDYIDQFGFRCMSEMKLEQKDLHLEPGLYFVFLKNLINCGQTDLAEYERREKDIRYKAEALLAKNLFGFKKIIYQWSLKQARQAVMNRENTRFCRTRIYGVVRSMFYAIGENFTKSNIIDKKEDIFYLSFQELQGAFEGTNTILNLKEVIALRKKEYEYFKTIEPSPRFMTRGPVYWNNLHTESDEAIIIDETPLLPHQLRGIPCSLGIVTGIVKVIMGPEDDMVLNGEILVTDRTDPGWIPLYPSISALLVERGGLLSHSAIVAREMGLPTIVGIKGLTKKLKSGMKVTINGETGLIEIVN